MKFNIGSTSTNSFSALPQLPPDHPAIPTTTASSASSRSRPPASCPMHNSSSSGTSSSSSSSLPIPPPNPDRPKSTSQNLAKCPIQHDSSSSSSSTTTKNPDTLNPLNSIPLGLTATKQPNQIMDLPTERTASSIPRPQIQEDDDKVWDYPSPQQFYNALVRKGWETPEESVEVMVAIHNFLNEKAWEEVMRWEKRLPGGEQAQLARFQGRPGDLSPKARFHLWAGKVFPSKFNTTPPFDRHDWIVTRPINPTTTKSSADSQNPSSTAETTTTRYVIDYYSAPPDEDGNPVFHLDVRPALDSLESINQRIKVGLEEWMKGQEE